MGLVLMLHERLKNIEQQNRSVIWTFVTFCVLVVSFPALYVFLCRLICPSNQSRYSVVWWRNIFRRNNLIILPYTKKMIWESVATTPCRFPEVKLKVSVVLFYTKYKEQGQTLRTCGLTLKNVWSHPTSPQNVFLVLWFGKFFFLGSLQKTPPMVKDW